MTDFPTLLEETGLAEREAAEYLNVNVSTIKKWKGGKLYVPDDVMEEMTSLAIRVHRVADGETIQLPKGSQRRAEKLFFRLHHPSTRSKV